MATYSNILGTTQSTFRIGLGTLKRLLTASASFLGVDSFMSTYGYHVPSVNALSLSSNVVAWDWSTSNASARQMATLNLGTATANTTLNITNMAVGMYYQLRVINHATAPVDLVIPNPTSWTIRFAGGKPTTILKVANSAVTILTLAVFGDNAIDVAVMQDMKQ